MRKFLLALNCIELIISPILISYAISTHSKLEIILSIGFLVSCLSWTLTLMKSVENKSDVEKLEKRIEYLETLFHKDR